MHDMTRAAGGDVSLHGRPPAPSIVFTGEDGAFRRLVSRGALLGLVTAGFYRFWLATDIRRYL